jgi:Mn-containing catalase
VFSHIHDLQFEYNMTDDDGVKRTLKFLIARDCLHQNQWLAAIQELQEDGQEGIPIPEAFDDDEDSVGAFAYIHASDGDRATEGRWASGRTPDGKGQFHTEAPPVAHGDRPVLPPGCTARRARTPPRGCSTRPRTFSPDTGTAPGSVPDAAEPKEEVFTTADWDTPI